MGYSLPLRFIKVANKTTQSDLFDVAICATRIVAIMSTEIYQARKTVHNEKKNGTLINAAGRSQVKSAIILDNGSVVASPFTVNHLMSAIEKSNFKQPGAKRINQTVRLKVYDVADEEPNEDLDEEAPDVTVEDGEYDYQGDLEEMLEEELDLEEDVDEPDYTTEKSDR